MFLLSWGLCRSVSLILGECEVLCARKTMAVMHLYLDYDDMNSRKSLSFVELRESSQYD